MYLLIMTSRPDALPTDAAALTEMVLVLDAENEKLHAAMQTMRDMIFGKRSERLAALVALAARARALETGVISPAPADDDAVATKPVSHARRRSAASALAKHLPRSSRCWSRTRRPAGAARAVCTRSAMMSTPRTISCTSCWPGTGSLPTRASRRWPHQPASRKSIVVGDCRRHALEQLDRGLENRTERRPVATSLPVLDGYIAAIVAGPVSISPLDWIGPHGAAL